MAGWFRRFSIFGGIYVQSIPCRNAITGCAITAPLLLQLLWASSICFNSSVFRFAGVMSIPTSLRVPVNQPHNNPGHTRA
jgi:hypothetical protein